MAVTLSFMDIFEEKAGALTCLSWWDEDPSLKLREQGHPFRKKGRDWQL